MNIKPLSPFLLLICFSLSSCHILNLKLLKDQDRMIFFEKNYSKQQEGCIPVRYSNDSSYLRLANDTAYFKTYKMKFGSKYYEGKGIYFLQDNIIYIKTGPEEPGKFTNYKEIGTSQLVDSLMIEVFDQNGARIPASEIQIRTRNDKLFIKSIQDEPEVISIKSYEYPIEIIVSGRDNSIEYAIDPTPQKYYTSLLIPIDSIKTNRVEVYLTEVCHIYDKIVTFELKKDEKGLFVEGPRIVVDDGIISKVNPFTGTYMIRIDMTGNKTVKMYAGE